VKASEAASAGVHATGRGHDDLTEPAGLESRQNGPSTVVETMPAALAGLAVPKSDVPLRRVAAGADPLGGEAIPGSVLAALKRRHGGGQPLPDEVAQPAGQALSQDLSPVRVHTDPEADRIARSVQSVAFTHGTDIYFTAGTYRPGERAGQHLLGHELAHVAQPASSAGGVIGRADDPAEAAADRAATGVVAALRRRAVAATSLDAAPEADVAPTRQLRRSHGLTIRRLLDGVTMQARYGMSDGNVVDNAALNGIFDTDEAAVKAVIGDPPNADKLKAFRLFLRNGGRPDDEIRLRWTTLKSINTRLGSAMHRVCRGNQTTYLTTDELTQLDADIGATSAETRTLLRTLTGEALAGAKLQQAVLATTPITPSVDWAVRTVHGAGGNAANGQLLAAPVRVLLKQAYDRHAPGSAHPDMAWGTGNWGSVPSNIEEHARKHMLRMGNADNPDPHEPFKWMARLGYSVTKAFVEEKLGADTPAVDALAMYNADGRVETQDQANHFFNVFLPANAAVANALLAAQQNAYRDNVQLSARAMADPIVTADGGKVQIVGQHGPLFIAGRWEGAATGFTISSGYLNSTKWGENQAKKAWGLT